MATADPTFPDAPNTAAYNADFIAGKFATPAFTDEGAIPGANPNSGPQRFSNPTLTPEQEAGFQTPSTEFISAPFTGGVDEANDREHLKTLESTQNYHTVSSRHHHLLAHAGRLADSADYLQEAGGEDPTTLAALDKHMALLAKYPGATGAAVNGARSNFAQIYNQHQTMTGQGWNQVMTDLGKGYITKDQIKYEPDGSVDYYNTHLLAAEQGGKAARTKAEASEETPEAKLFSKALAIHAIPEPDQMLAGSNTPNPDHAEWAKQKAWATKITTEFMKAHPTSALPTVTSPQTPAGPSPEFTATQNRFRTPGQIESLPATIPAMKGSAITGRPQVQDFFPRKQ